MRYKDYNNRGRSYQLNQQNGVVLISCIIFLVLILLMLRISLGGAQISERKSGIEREILSAEQSAQLAMRAAERDILSLPVVKGNLTACPSGNTDESTECHEVTQKIVRYTWMTAWLTDEEAGTVPGYDALKEDEKTEVERLRALMTSSGRSAAFVGFYNGRRANDAPCANEPLWHCVDWDPAGKGYFYAKGYTKPTRNILASREVVVDDINAQTDVSPRYIVERFLPEDIGLDKSANMLLRVTAVGYGDSGGSDEGVSSALYQANYTM